MKASIVAIFISPTAVVSLEGEQLKVMGMWRVLVWIPLIGGGIVGTLLFAKSAAFLRYMTALCLYSVICNAVIAPPGLVMSLDQTTNMILPLIFVIYFLAGLPFRRSVSVVACTHLALFAVVIRASAERQNLLVYCAIIASITLGLHALLAYRLERTSREAFFAERQLEIEHNNRLAVERDRIHWLETIAGFTRHELKNAMTGIGSSIDLAEQTGADQESLKYLGRAKRSLGYMRRFLNRVSEASSLEAALAEQQLEIIDLSQLIQERADDYRTEYNLRSFVTDVERNIWVRGNADRLVQMLDKIVNNAIEHGAVESPIEIVLHLENDKAVLRVNDIGDAPPEDVEQIFEPFISNKQRRGKDNLGLGLYVARVIATHHGGVISVHRLCNPDGAEFRVELPSIRAGDYSVTNKA